MALNLRAPVCDSLVRWLVLRDCLGNVRPSCFLLPCVRAVLFRVNYQPIVTLMNRLNALGAAAFSFNDAPAANDLGTNWSVPRGSLFTLAALSRL